MARIPPVSEQELQPSVRVAFDRHVKDLTPESPI
jgi:hypothetical protein